ncbi:hypothetical protein HK102_012599, partial [Quaeritorhiza haematococci]
GPRGGGELRPAGRVLGERAGLGQDLDDLVLAERQRGLAARQHHQHALALLRLRVGHDLPLDLAAPSQDDHVRPRGADGQSQQDRKTDAPLSATHGDLASPPTTAPSTPASVHCRSGDDASTTFDPSFGEVRRGRRVTAGKLGRPRGSTDVAPRRSVAIRPIVEYNLDMRGRSDASGRRGRAMTADRPKGLAWTGILLALAATPALGDDAFEAEIRPLLVERCQSCHGPEKQKAGLRLDARAALIEGGDTGPAVVPGDPANSLLIEAVRQTGDLQMPPKEKLPPEQIAALERWIAAGAPWPESSSPAVASRKDAWARHWAFQPVVDRPVPTVSDPSRVRTPVDAFVQARLEAAGLAPAPAAARRARLRADI